MRTQHDIGCLWWKDWHNCSCGYLEEEIRNERIALQEPFLPVFFGEDLLSRVKDLTDGVDLDIDEPLSCNIVIPGTFIVCGEDVGQQKQFCSKKCYEKHFGVKNGKR